MRQDCCEQQPQIVVSKVGDRYGIVVSGKFGGGYSVRPSLSAEEVAAKLARDWRGYDCGAKPIIITAPKEIRELAGLSTEKTTTIRSGL